jgi:hypothetical protein
MTAATGRRAGRAMRRAASAIRKARDEQVYMWECFWLSNRAVPTATTGPLSWIPSLDGYRLSGSYLPGQDQGADARETRP